MANTDEGLLPSYFLDTSPTLFEEVEVVTDVLPEAEVRRGDDIPKYAVTDDERGISRYDPEKARKLTLDPEDERPWYESIGEGIAFGMLEAGTNIYDTMADVANYVEEDILDIEEGEDFIPNESARELLGLEEGQYEIENLDTLGQVAAGMTQFGVGLIPAAGIFRVAGLANRLASPAAKAAAAAGGRNAVNVGASMSRFKSYSKSAGMGILAEQLAFDPTDRRLGDALADTEIPLLQEIGELTKSIDEDSEDGLQLQNRLRMAAEGLGIGIAVESGVRLVTFAGKKILPAALSKDIAAEDAALEGIQIDATPAQFVKERKERLIKAVDEGRLTVEDVEEFETILRDKKEGGVTAAINWLRERELYDIEMAKYFGSINSTRVQLGGIEPYNLLKETAEMLKEQAEKAGEQWPPKRSYTELLEEKDKFLFDADNEEVLTKYLEQGRDHVGSVLSVSSGRDGAEIALSADLNNLSVYVLAARQVLANQAEYTMQIAKEAKADLKSTTDPVRALEIRSAVAQSVMAFESLQKTYNNVPNEIGRALSVFNAPLSGGKLPNYVSKLVKDSQDDIDALIDVLGDTKHVDALDMLEALSKAEAKEAGRFAKLKEYWYNSILSAPDTALVNVSGNLGVQIARTVVEGSIAAVIGQTRIALGADPSKVKTFGDVAAGIRGMTFGKADYNPALAQDMEKLIDNRVIFDIQKGKYGSTNLTDILDDLTKKGHQSPQEVLRQRAREEIEKEMAAGMTNFAKSVKLSFLALAENPAVRARFSERADSEFVQQGGAGLIKGVKGRIIRFPSGIMSAGDTMFKSMSQNRALYEEANRILRGIKYQFKNGESPQKLKTVTGKEIVLRKDDFEIPVAGPDGKINPRSMKYGEFVETLVSNPTPEMLARANSQMLEDTFQQDGMLTQGTLFLRDKLNKFSGGFLGTIMVPFVKTPLNIMLYTFDRMPLIAMANPKNLRDFKGQKQDEIIARQLAGATYLGGGFTLASMGLITGGYPLDAKARRNLDKNWRPYSVKIGDKYYPYTRFDPFAMFAGFAANMQRAYLNIPAEVSRAERESLYRMGTVIMKGMTEGFTTMVTDKTYLKNIGEIGDIVFNPKKGEGIFEKTGQFFSNVPANAVGGLIPAVVGRVGEGLDIRFFYDPIMRDTYVDVDFLTRFVYGATARVPGLREAVRENADEMGLGESSLAKKLFPSVDQFGEHRVRDEGFPAFVPVTRVFDPKKNPEAEGRVTPMEDAARLGKELAQLGVDGKYSDRKFDIPGTKVKQVLPRNFYYYKARHEGIFYAQTLLSLVDSDIYKTMSNRQKIDAINDVKKQAADYADYKIGLVMDSLLEQMDIDITDAQRSELVKKYGRIERRFLDRAAKREFLQ